MKTVGHGYSEPAFEATPGDGNLRRKQARRG